MGVIANPDPYSLDDGSASIVGIVRLVLAVSTIITVLTDPEVIQKLPWVAWLIFSGFILHNVALFFMTSRAKGQGISPLTTWIDIGWYTLLVFVTGSDTSLFFLFYFFAILVSSFRHGFDEGARVTLASAILFSMTAHSTINSPQLLQVLLRAAFLLALGYMIARWGEANLIQKRRLGLLREVSQLSNPRFGVEQTITDVMQKVRLFFKANACVMVSRKATSPSWMLRIINESGARAADLPSQQSSDAAPLLMSLPDNMPVIYLRPLARWLPWTGMCCYYDAATDEWHNCDGTAGDRLAELLDARSFISTPLCIQSSEGRAFMARAKGYYTKADVMFLVQIAAQVVPVLENIYLLDRLATEAALRERRKISRDLHDATLQPYIGLSHTLTALRAKATPDNPLLEDIDALTNMTTQVISDLRNYVGGFTREVGSGEALFFGAIRHHLRQVRMIYGIDIALEAPVSIDIGDRLATAVLHMVREGISNIRKHTTARQGCVRLQFENGVLGIEIENPNDEAATPLFAPVSICDRTHSLGGKVMIQQRRPGRTVVCIDIPV